MLWKRRTSFKMYSCVFYHYFWRDTQSSRIGLDRIDCLIWKFNRRQNWKWRQKAFFFFEIIGLTSTVFHFLSKKTHRNIIIWLVVYLKNSKPGSRTTLFIWFITSQRVCIRKKQKWKETHMRCFFDFALKSNRKLTFPTNIEPCNLIHRLFCNKNEWKFAWQTTNRWCFVFTDQKTPTKQEESEREMSAAEKTLFITLG